MNQLETLIIPTETVDFNGQKLEVRGLGFADITYIVRHHRAVVAGLYTQAIEGKLQGSVEEIALSLLDDFAPLASMVVACALDAPKLVETAGKLPVTVQAQILEKAVTLTLVGEGGLEKLMEIVIRAMAGAASLTSPKA